MKIIQQSFKIEYPEEVDQLRVCKRLEIAGRKCYQSTHKITKNSAVPFVKMLVKNNHLSVLEHEKVTVTIITNRGVTHELVRHRLGAYSQESTRYCRYNDELTIIGNSSLGVTGSAQNPDWFTAMAFAQTAYLRLLDAGVKPEIARDVLPNALKTEITVTYNLRQWLHVLDLRTSRRAHPQMRELMLKILFEFGRQLPVIFGDLAFARCI